MSESKAGIHRGWRYRRGYLMVELVVAASLLVTVMTLVASMTPRLSRLWQEAAHQRAATMELSDQLERLTLLSTDRAREALEHLSPSDQAAAALPEPELTGELVDDSLGRRIVVKISWQHRHQSPPLEMVGWLHAASGPDSGDAEEAETSDAPAADASAAPENDAGDVPQSDNGDVPQSDNGDVPETGNGGNPETDSGGTTERQPSGEPAS